MNQYERARQAALDSGMPYLTGELAKNIKEGQVIEMNGVWNLVVNNYLHSKSPYAKMNLIPISEIEHYKRERISGCAYKFYGSSTVLVVKEEFILNISTIEAVEKSSALANKIGDYHQLMLSSNDRIEALSGVFIDKSVVAKALLNEATALNRQIGELLKKDLTSTINKVS